MKRLFVDIDTQNDFMDPNGALYVAGALKLIPNFNKLLDCATEVKDNFLIGSMDTHNFQSREFEENGGPFPPHCVKGTWGWCKYYGLLSPRSRVLYDGLKFEDVAAIFRTNCSAMYFEKDANSIFESYSFLVFMKRIWNLAPEIYVFGLATEYCVKCAAIGFLEYGYKVNVVTDAIAPVTAQGGLNTLEEFRSLGIKLVTTQDVIDGCKE